MEIIRIIFRMLSLLFMYYLGFRRGKKSVTQEYLEEQLEEMLLDLEPEDEDL